MNKQERTYAVLRDRIHSGEYRPLDRLNIDAMARELGVSPIPVREALRRLEAEGWVQFRPNVGAVVAPVDATSWEQSMVALAVLEGAATAEARAHLRKVDLTKLRRIAAQMERAVATGEALRFSALNHEFHDAIVERCPNEVLRQLLAQTHRRLDQVRRTMFVYLPDRSQAALTEHLHLLDLLETGDEEQVERYARWHKLQTVEAYRALHEVTGEWAAGEPPARPRKGA